MSTNGEVTIYTHFYCIQGCHMLFVPLIRRQRGWLDNFSPPTKLSSFVKPWLTDQGVAWSCSFVRCGAFGAACLESDIWS